MRILLLALFFIGNQAGAPDTLYVESWKSGGRRVAESQFAVRLAPPGQRFETWVKDDSGRDRYHLGITLRGAYTNSGSPYQYAYADLREQGPDGLEGANLLEPSNDVHRDHSKKEDYVAYLEPTATGKSCANETRCIPFSQRRVIKVEGFYCVIQAKSYKHSPDGTRDVMTVRVEFTNEYKS